MTDIAELLKQFLKQQKDIQLAIVFGSLARDEQRPDSDLGCQADLHIF